MSNLDEYSNALNNFLGSDDFSMQEESQAQKNLASFRNRYVFENPEVNVDDVDEITENRNISFLRNTGRGRAIPIIDIKYPSQEKGYKDLNTKEKLEKIEEFKLKIPEIAKTSPTQKEDTEYFINQSVRQLERQANGEDTGWVGDKSKRLLEGFAAGLASSIGADSASESIKDYFHENTEYDEDFSSHLAQGLGSAGSSILIIAGAAAASGGLGATAGVANAIGTGASLASNGIMRYNEGYKNAINSGLNEDQAHESGISAMPAAVIDALSDKIIASKLMPKHVNKVFAEGSDVAKKAMVGEVIANVSLRGKLTNWAQSAIAEGISESAGDYAAAYGPYLKTGDDKYLPNDKESANSFIIGAIIGGGIPAVIDTPSILGNKKGKEITFTNAEGVQETMTPKYSTTTERDVRESERNISKLGSVEAKGIYELLAKGHYKEARMASDALLTPVAPPAQNPANNFTAPGTTPPPTQPPTSGPTGPTVTGPTVTGPTVTGPTVTGPTVTGPTVTGPTVTPAPVINGASPGSSATINENLSTETEEDIIAANPEPEKQKAALEGRQKAAQNALGNLKVGDTIINSQGEEVVIDEEGLKALTPESFLPKVEVDDKGGKVITPGFKIKPVATKPASAPIVATTTTPVSHQDFKISDNKTLGNPQPRYKNDSVKFTNDFDKIAYLLAGDSKGASKSAPKFRAAIAGLGLNINDVIAHGKKIKASLKAGKAKDGSIEYAPIEFTPTPAAPPSETRSKTMSEAEKAAEDLRRTFGFDPNEEENTEEESSEVGNDPVININESENTDTAPEPLPQPVSTVVEHLNNLLKTSKPKDKKIINRMIADLQLKNPNVKFATTNNPKAKGYYDPNTNTIHINPLYYNDMLVLSHEIAHALTAADVLKYITMRPEATYKEKLDAASFDENTPSYIKSLINSYYHAAKILGKYDSIGLIQTAENIGELEMSDTEYAFSSMDEFLAHALSSQEFQNQLSLIAYNGSNVWQAIVEAVRSALKWIQSVGSPEYVMRSDGENVLRAVLAASRQIIESGEAPYNQGIETASGQILFFPGYHGTPHKVDRFSSDKIGTGEGAQAFGYGLYVAGSQKVGEYYRDAITARKKAVEFKVGDRVWDSSDPLLIDFNTNEDTILAYLSGWITQGIDLSDAIERGIKYYSNDKYSKAYVNILEKLKNEGIEVIKVINPQGNLYTVDLAPDESEFLDWDLPLSEQPDKIKDIISKSFIDYIKSDEYKSTIWGWEIQGKIKGKQVFDGSSKHFASKEEAEEWIKEKENQYNKDKYFRVSSKVNQTDLDGNEFKAFISISDMSNMEEIMRMKGREHYDSVGSRGLSPKQSSELLYNLGIPGIKYRDGNSRNNKGEPNYNYVIFNDKDIRITHENGVEVTPEEVIAERSSQEAKPKVNINFLPNAKFRSQRDLEKLLEGKNEGVFKSLQPAQDGSLPWQAVKSKLSQAYRAEELQLIGDTLEGLVTNGRLPLREAVESINTLAKASINVERFNAANNFSENKIALGKIQHELDTVWGPRWPQDRFRNKNPNKEGEKLFDEYNRLSRLVFNEPDDKESESATARFTTVNPKPLSEMEDAGDITIEESYKDPVPGYPDQWFSNESKIKFQESTHFPTRKNILGFIRKYTETMPKESSDPGAKVSLGFEGQSDWKNEVRFNKDTGKWDVVIGNYHASFDTEQEAIQDHKDPIKQKQYGSVFNSIYETLILKALIHDAFSLGHNYIAITDAETAMMTERHDKYAVAAFKKEQIGKWYVLNNDTGNTFGMEKTKEDAEKVLSDLIFPDKQDLQVFQVTEDMTIPDISQEKGMRAAYDPEKGRLHTIMRKLTGSKGEKVNFGFHQNADNSRDTRSTGEPGSKVFKESDGTPKSSITAIVYPLDQVDKQEISTLFPGGSAPTAKPKVNINFLPEQTRAAQLATSYARFRDITKGNINDKVDVRTQNMISLLGKIRHSDIHKLPNEIQDAFFVIVNNVYQARKSAIKDPAIRIDSNEILEKLNVVVRAIDANRIADMVADYDSLIDFDKLNIDTTDRTAVEEAINEWALHSQTAEAMAKRDNSEKAKAARKSSLDAIDQKFREMFNEMIQIAEDRFVNADNYLDEYESIYGKLNNPTMEAIMKAHFNYLTNLNIDDISRKELRQHSFAIQNLLDGNTYGIGDLTCKHVAEMRNIEDKISRLKLMYQDPMIDTYKIANTLDKYNREAEILQTRLQRLSAYEGLRKFNRESLLGGINHAVISTSMNEKIERQEEFEKFSIETLGESTEEDKIIMDMASRAMRWMDGANQDKELVKTIKKELESIKNKIDGADTRAARNQYRTTILPLYQELTKGLEAYGDGAMAHFIETLPQRLNGFQSDPSRGKKRADVIQKGKDIFSRYEPASRIISEGFNNTAFVRYVSYSPNNVQSVSNENEPEWDITKDPDTIGKNIGSTSITAQAAHLKEVQESLGDKGYYSYNFEYTMKRNIERMSVHNHTIVERFILKHRIAKGSELGDIISLNKDGNHHYDRLKFINIQVRDIIGNATSAGVPLDAITEAFRAATNAFAQVSLSSPHHLIDQPVAAFFDYGVRTKNLKGLMDAALFYATNFTKANDFFDRYQKWTGRRSAVEAQGLDNRRTPNPDEKFLSSKFVKSLSKFSDKAGRILTIALHHGDAFSVKVIILAEYTKMLKEKGYKFDSIFDINFREDVEGRLLSSATYNAELVVNTSNKIFRGNLFADKKTSTTVFRNLLFAFASHSGNLATQMNQAIRDIANLKSEGAPMEEIEAKLRTIGAISAQQFVFTSGRFLIGGMATSAMVALVSDLFDDEEGKIEDLQIKLFIAREKGNKAKIAEAENELANAKTVRSIITKFNYSHQSGDSWFKQVLRDQTGTLHLSLNNNAMQKGVFFLLGDPFLAQQFKRGQKQAEDSMKEDIKAATEKKDYKLVAKLTEQQTVLNAAEYIPLAYDNNQGLGLSGLYGAVSDQFFRAANEAQGGISGTKEYNYTDFISALAVAGIGQSEVAKYLRLTDRIEDEQWKRNKEFEEVRLPAAKKADKEPKKISLGGFR